MALEVAVMEPKYQQNLGYISRVSKNFGIEKLIIINPRCNYKGREAIKYSKHARELLEKATILDSIKDIDADLIIGTTGIWHKTNASYYNVYGLEKLSKFAKRINSARIRVVLLLGRDDTGLSREELRECDATVFVSASKDYPVLNISHALAIILSRIAEKRKVDYAFMNRIYADSKSERNLFRLFGDSLKGNKKIRDKESVLMAFRHVVRRSVPTRKEINALSIALAPEEKNELPRAKALSIM
jgi:tRNA/rRNA methyltransferase